MGFGRSNNVWEDANGGPRWTAGGDGEIVASCSRSDNVTLISTYRLICGVGASVVELEEASVVEAGGQAVLILSWSVWWW